MASTPEEQRLDQPAPGGTEPVSALLIRAAGFTALVDRFHAAYDPVADAGIIQSGDLSESAGELVQTLQEIVDQMEEVQADALAAGVDPEAVDCSAECAMSEALAAAYAAWYPQQPLAIHHELPDRRVARVRHDPRS